MPPLRRRGRSRACRDPWPSAQAARSSSESPSESPISRHLRRIHAYFLRGRFSHALRMPRCPRLAASKDASSRHMFPRVAFDRVLKKPSDASCPRESGALILAALEKTFQKRLRFDIPPSRGETTSIFMSRYFCVILSRARVKHRLSTRNCLPSIERAFSMPFRLVTPA